MATLNRRELLSLVPALALARPDLSIADRTAWYRSAKFGLFLHWGPYSVAGVEASWPIMVPNLIKRAAISEADYRALPAQFNPLKFNPKAWVKMAKDAGMRYIVFTTKHHDGFCMFDAPGTDYKITRTPYGKDIVAQLAAACKEARMPLGLYYSPPDMNHPGYRDTSKPATTNWMGEPSRPEWASYLDFMESHLRHLLTNYGEVATIWFDGLLDQKRYDPARFHALIHKLSPATLINDRLGPGGDYVTPEQFVLSGIPVKRAKPLPDMSPQMLQQMIKAMETMPIEKLIQQFSGMQKILYPTRPAPTPEEFQLWETCMTMNDTWGYCPQDTNWKSSDKLIRTLVEVSSRGGNFLLNIGPSPLGEFPPQAVENLKSVGAWMKANGEAIYDTTWGPLQDLPFGRTTARNGTVYLHILDSPTGKLIVPGLAGKTSSVAVLAKRKKLRFTQSADRIEVDLPSQPSAPSPVVLAFRT